MIGLLGPQHDDDVRRRADLGRLRAQHSRHLHRRVHPGRRHLADRSAGRGADRASRRWRASTFSSATPALASAMRAAAQDVEIAETQGVDTRRTYRIAFFVAILLAALAGALWGQIYAVSPFLGERPLMMAFIVVILGGMGSIPGAALGGVHPGLHRELHRHILRRSGVRLPVVRRRHPAADRAPMGHPRHPGNRDDDATPSAPTFGSSPAIALLGWPWLTDDKFFHHVGVLICLTSIGAASLHLIIRTGHVSLGPRGLRGDRCLRLGDHRDAARAAVGRSAWSSASGAAALLAAIVGPIVLRLTGKYFVLITFLFGEMVRMAIVESSVADGRLERHLQRAAAAPDPAVEPPALLFGAGVRGVRRRAVRAHSRQRVRPRHGLPSARASVWRNARACR